LQKTEESTTEIPDIVDEDFENFFSATSVEYELVVTAVANGVNDEDNMDQEDPTPAPSWLTEDHDVVRKSGCITTL